MHRLKKSKLYQYLNTIDFSYKYGRADRHAAAATPTDDEKLVLCHKPASENS